MELNRYDMIFNSITIGMDIGMEFLVVVIRLMLFKEDSFMALFILPSAQSIVPLTYAVAFVISDNESLRLVRVIFRENPNYQN